MAGYGPSRPCLKNLCPQCPESGQTRTDVNDPKQKSHLFGSSSSSVRHMALWITSGCGAGRSSTKRKTCWRKPALPMARPSAPLPRPHRSTPEGKSRITTTSPKPVNSGLLHQMDCQGPPSWTSTRPHDAASMSKSCDAGSLDPPPPARQTRAARAAQAGCTPTA